MAWVLNGLRFVWIKYRAACPSGEMKIAAAFLNSSLFKTSGGMLNPAIEGFDAAFFMRQQERRRLVDPGSHLFGLVDK